METFELQPTPENVLSAFEKDIIGEPFKLNRFGHVRSCRWPLGCWQNVFCEAGKNGT